MQPDPIELLTRVAQILRASGIENFATGSVGSTLYGEPRYTQGVDLVVALNPEQAETLFQAAEGDFYADLGAMQEAVARASSFNWIHLRSNFKIDFHVSGGGEFDSSRFSRCREVEGFMVASPEDVLLGKLRWFRMGGEVSDRQWRDILGILLVQAERLDLTYLKQWASLLGLSDLLERARAQAA